MGRALPPLQYERLEAVGRGEWGERGRVGKEGSGVVVVHRSTFHTSFVCDL